MPPQLVSASWPLLHLAVVMLRGAYLSMQRQQILNCSQDFCLRADSLPSLALNFVVGNLQTPEEAEWLLAVPPRLRTYY